MRGIACALALAVPRVGTFALRTSIPLTLPFESYESMLPGDTRELHVYDQALADLLDIADREHDGLVGQLLATDGTPRVPFVTWTSGDEQRQVAAWLPLLHVMEIRDPWQLYGWTEEDPILMWAEVRCIGRVMLQGDGHVLALESPPGEEEAIQTSSVVPYADATVSDPESITATNLVLEVEKLRRACFEDELLVSLRKGEAPKKTRTLNDAERRRRETERRARAEPSAEVGAASLSERMNALEAILKWQGLDASPATSLEELYGLWNVRSEQEGWLQLASYAALGWLRPEARMEGLQSRSTLERLELVCRELEAERKSWSAKIALQKLGKELRRDNRREE